MKQKVKAKRSQEPEKNIPRKKCETPNIQRKNGQTQPEPSPTFDSTENHHNLIASERNLSSSDQAENVDNKSVADERPRPVRLFVGQVPESMVEPELSQLFGTIGVTLLDIAVIRDKHTGRHRHCAFVTVPSREAADVAISEFHNKKYLPAMANPMQVKEANQPKSKAAYAAMRAYSQMFGTPMPIFAAQSSKSVYRPSTFTASFVPVNSFFAANFMPQMQMQAVTSHYQNASFPPYLYGYVPATMTAPGQMSMNVPSTMYGYQQQPMIYPISSDMNNLDFGVDQSLPPSTNEKLNQNSSQNSNQDLELNEKKLLINTDSPDKSPTYSNFYSSQVPTTGQQQGTVYYTNQLQSTSQPFYPSFQSTYINGQQQQQPEIDSSEQSKVPYSEGPPGANLFINNLPEKCTDEDLCKMFTPFGKVISFKVFIDKYTQKSKGFGFISYATVQEADLAIKHMSGYQIGEKTLTVELKRTKKNKLQEFF